MAAPTSPLATPPMASQVHFQDLWASAIQEFQQTSNISAEVIWLPQLRNISLEDLRKRINKQNQDYKHFRKRREKFEEILTGFLGPLRKFSDIIGAGVSVVFPPAQAIFAAVSFLIESAQGTFEAYNAIIELLERVKYSSERISLYCEHGVPPQLEPIAKETLILYLKIFAISIRRMRGNQLAFFASITFLGNDDGIDAALVKLGRLTDEQNSTLAALSYELGWQTSDTLSKIAAFLGINELNSKNVFEEKFPSENIFKEREYDKFNSKISSWITSEDEFRNWCRGDFRFLWICGSTGMGRSYLTYNIVKYLRSERYVNSQTWSGQSRPSIAYFFCMRQCPPLLSIKVLLRTIAYQIAEQDRSYAGFLNGYKDLVRGYDTAAFEGNDFSFLWKELFEDYFAEASNSSSAFIIIYGLDEVEPKQRRRFLELLGPFEPVQKNLKPKLSIVLITKQQAGDELRKSFGKIEHCVEVLPARTKRDLDQYINFMIEDNLLYVKKKRKGLRKQIMECLQRNANGSFLWVNAMIEELKQLDEKEQIEKCINDAPKSWQEAFASNLEQLSSALTDRQIDTLNYMLSWVALAPGLLSLRALGQALRIKDEEGSTVLDLSDLIYYRYGSIFSLTTSNGGPLQAETSSLQEKAGLVQTASSSDDSSVPSKVEGGSTDEDDESEDDPTNDYLFISLKHAGIRSYFLSDAQPPGVRIRLQATSAKAMVLRMSLQVFCDDRKYNICQDSLAQYAAQFGYLIADTEPTTVPLEDQITIAQLLVQVLRTKQRIARWVAKAGEPLNIPFLNSAPVLASLQKWLVKSGIEHHIDPSGHLGPWYSNLVYAEMPYRCLFEEVAKECACRWLQSVNNSPDNAVVFLNNYVSRISGGQETAQPSLRQIPRTTIEKLWDWASSRVEKKAKIHLFRLAGTFLRMGDVSSAVEYGLKAVAADPENGLAHTVLGNAYIQSGDHERACECLLKGQSLLAESEAKLRLRNFLKLYAFGAVSTTALPAISSDDEDGGGVLLFEDYLDELLRHEEFSEATKALKKLLNRKLSREFCWALSIHIPHHQRLAIYARKTGNIELVEQLYKKALQTLVKWHTNGAQPVFRYFYALLHIRLNSDLDDALPLLQQAIEEFRKQKTIESEYEKVRYISEIHLRSVYLIKAIKRPSLETIKAESYLLDLARDLRQQPMANVSALAVAVWYRQTQQMQQCRDVLGPFIAEAFGAIGRARDRVTGWHKLADALNASGDTVNAVAALSYIKQSRIWEGTFCYRKPTGRLSYRPPPESQPTITWVTDSARDVNAVIHKGGEWQDLLATIQKSYPDVKGFAYAAYSGFMCDGCAKVISCCETHFRCTICIQIDFCAGCHATVKSGVMPLNVCDPEHSFLHIGSEHLACPKGKIRVGSYTQGTTSVDLAKWLTDLRVAEIDLEQWLDALQTQWQISAPVQGKGRAFEAKEKIALLAKKAKEHYCVAQKEEGKKRLARPHESK